MNSTQVEEFRSSRIQNCIAAALPCPGCQRPTELRYAEHACESCRRNGTRVGAWEIALVLPYVAPSGAMWAACHEDFDGESPNCLNAPTLAGVIELVLEWEAEEHLAALEQGKLKAGSRVRILRGSYTGCLATVAHVNAHHGASLSAYIDGVTAVHGLLVEDVEVICDAR